MTMDAYIAAGIGFATAAVLAAVNSWLTGREKVAEGVRDERIKTYPSVWRRTGIVSRWPRTNAGREHYLRLHEDLRKWYYGGGGLYLSTRSRKRYEHLQLVLEAVLAQKDPKSDVYEPVMQAASYFRTGLTDDLETRDRRNPFVAVRQRWDDWSERRKADVRLKSLNGGASASASPALLHSLTPEDERVSTE
jgi:hypothetical protein